MTASYPLQTNHVTYCQYYLDLLLSIPPGCVLQYVSVCFSVFQYVAVFYTCVTVFYTWFFKFRFNPVVFCRMVQRVALASPTVYSIAPEVFPPHPQNHLLHILWGTWRNARTWVSQQGQGALANGQRYDSKFLRLLELLGGRERAKQGQLP